MYVVCHEVWSLGAVRGLSWGSGSLVGSYMANAVAGSPTPESVTELNQKQVLYAELLVLRYCLRVCGAGEQFWAL